MTDLQITAWDTVEAFLFAALEIQETTYALEKFGDTGKGTCSMHRHGRAGIQNSVLSFDSANRDAIRVRRVCWMRGKLMTDGTYRSSSLAVLLPLLDTFPKMVLPALPSPPAALLEVFLRFVKR